MRVQSADWSPSSHTHMHTKVVCARDCWYLQQLLRIFILQFHIMAASDLIKCGEDNMKLLICVFVCG